MFYNTKVKILFVRVTNMKKLFHLIGLLFVLIVFGSYLFAPKKTKIVKNTIATVFSSPSYINKNGNTVINRVKIPEDFTRVTYSEGSFQSFIQNYALKNYGVEVINYDGSKYFYQSGHIGVLDLSVPKNGLQQCADALIRLRSEYLWKTNQKNKIGFEFTSGHYCSWKKYAEGYRPKVKGNKVSFHKTAVPNATKANFYKYLNLIYMYSGTLSLYNELPKIKKNFEVGDMLVNPGTPGHIVMIVDKIRNLNGEFRYILAQGNTPAQSVHMLKNPTDTKMSPWYNLQLNAYTEVPGYYFNEAKFIRFK